MELTNNSITTLLPKFTKLFNNNLESYNKISEAIVSTSKEVYIEIVDDAGNIKKIPIPTFKFLLSELERLDFNINQLSNLTDGKVAYVKNGESLRRVLVSKYGKEAKDIVKLNNVNSFYFKSNNFFESLMNPNIYVEFDISSSVDKECESIMVERYILKDLSDANLDWFNVNYKNRIDIDRVTFLNDLTTLNIPYILDDGVTDLPPKELIYSGNFSVLAIYETEYDELINDVTYKRKRKMYKLDKLTYTDLRYGVYDNVNLKQGDVLLLNDDTTAYVIDVIDRSTNSISLTLRDGYGSINLGDNIFKFYSDDIVSTIAEISIGFNEYNVIFIKGLNANFKIPSKNWSLGVAFYCNELTIDINGTTETLESFYKREVLDFGLYLQSLAKDKIPPSYLGLTPDAPVLSASDFKVVQINKHMFETKAIQEIKDIEKEKTKLQSEIDTLTKAIDKDRNNQKLINDKNAKTQLYNSIVKEIDSKARDNNLYDLTPKYRVRGFFPLPIPKTSLETGSQDVIQFLISYRYLSKSGVASPIDQFQFNDNNKVRIGVLADWVDVLGPKKTRAFDDSGNAYWVEEKVEDSTVTNINSIDIPIQKGEIVEVRVKSISEAGYPTNPSMSDFSNSVRIEFPATLENSNILNDIIDTNKKDVVLVDLETELDALGVYKHIASSYEVNQIYYTHPSTDIDSGFRTTEQNIIPLFDKLLDLNTRIQKVEEIQQKKTPMINVKLIDSDGNEIAVKKDQLNKIFAGYYTDFIEGLNIPKGKIITKTYFLTIENLSANDLELISRIPGTNTRMVKESDQWKDTVNSGYHDYYSNYNTFEQSDNDYNTIRKYDLAPILLTNPSEYDSNNEITNKVPRQSAQVKAQYIYVRTMDIAKEEDFHCKYIPDSSGNITSTLISVPQDVENSYGRTGVEAKLSGFIWGGSFDINGLPTKAETFQINDDTIEVHLNHPYIKHINTFKYNYELIFGVGTFPAYTYSGGIVSYPGGPIDFISLAKKMFLHTKFMNLLPDSPAGKKQSIYVYDGDRTTKMSFAENDDYLIGKQSCGTYLFIAPEDHDFICVDGKSLLSKKVIKYGTENIVKIPILFQFRMTDYYGTGDSGFGNIGGDVNGLITNMTLAKYIGFDIFDSNNNTFSFDLELSAKYKQDNLNQNAIPTKKIGTSIDAIAKNLENVVVKANVGN